MFISEISEIICSQIVQMFTDKKKWDQKFPLDPINLILRLRLLHYQSESISMNINDLDLLIVF